MNGTEPPINSQTTSENFFQNILQWREENKNFLLTDGEASWYLHNLHAFYDKLPMWAWEDDEWE